MRSIASAETGKRPYHQIEKRLVAEYMHEHFREAPQWIRPRLGKFRAPKFGTEDDVKDRIWEQVTQRFPDAVAFDGENLHIIEGKIIADAKAAGQLEHYQELIRETEEFMAFEDAGTILKVIAVRIPDDIKTFLRRRGIQTEIYAPDWAVRYMEARQFR